LPASDAAPGAEFQAKPKSRFPRQVARRVSTLPSLHALLTESGEPEPKENDLTDAAKKPTDDSKEELTEAELDQVAGGFLTGAAVAKKHAQPETLIRPGSAVVAKTHTQPEKIPQPATVRVGGA
jgi:hypothetical protein